MKYHMVMLSLVLTLAVKMHKKMSSLTNLVVSELIRILVCAERAIKFKVSFGTCDGFEIFQATYVLMQR